ncbi:hypothetical protein HHI36_022608 [Cryptolaemus montrouzieri]|uniref:Uncharacterized protein n=1 Tax=Cryptolaemus montrouzieri TaxID=559131 RepID=A0ABD2N0G7_9CUCU
METMISKAFTTVGIIDCINMIMHENEFDTKYVSVTSNLSGFDFPLLNVDYMENILMYSYLKKADIYIMEENDFEQLIHLMNNMKNPFKIGFKKIAQCDETFSKTFQETAFVWKNSSVSINYRLYNAFAMCVKCKKKGMEIDISDIIFEHFDIDAHFLERKNETVEMLDEYNILLGNLGLEDVELLDIREFSHPFIGDAVVWAIPLPDHPSRWKYFYQFTNIGYGYHFLQQLL